LADQYVAGRKAERSVLKGHDSSTKGHVFKPRSFGESGRDRSSAGLQNAVSFSNTIKAHDDHKSSVPLLALSLIVPVLTGQVK